MYSVTTLHDILKCNKRSYSHMSFIGNIQTLVMRNDNFREVVFTGKKSQLVVMSIPPGEEVGEEIHPGVEQTLYIVSGTCNVVLDNNCTQVTAGDVIVVTPGTLHNFINNGDETVKVITTYSPPNHIDGRIHVTRIDAEEDEADEEFGNQNV